jgi:threonine/homoserine/homoserine lactone efflux protein
MHRLSGMDASTIPLLLKSALIGLSIAAPVGPIGLLCIQRTLDHGPRVGLATGLGAAVADALYGAVGAFGVTAVIALLTDAHALLAVGGALFLLWLAWSAWNGADSKQAAVAQGGVKGWHAFGGTFLLTLSNPATILSFIAVFSSLAGGMGAVSPLWMIAGVFIGSAAWWFILVGAVGRMRERLQMRHLRWIRRGSALLLAGFAACQLASLAAS